MASSTLWERVKGGSKKGFDAGWKALDKLGAPTNRLSNKLGSEAFWPTTLDKESEKAARILKSFCKDGFYQEEKEQTIDGPKQKQKVLKKIPQQVIKNAKGLAIFTTMRTGLWVSGAGGSGILIARQSDGSWSPPSGIMLHTAGLGFLVGIDIYDCVVVINSEKALEAFTKVRCTLGSEVSVTAGPVGAGGVLESEIHKRHAPIFTYMKSRGFYAGVQIDGTIIIERTDENERFYHERVPVADILAGKVRHPPHYEYRQLTETLKAAQGDNFFDEAAIPDEPPPGDYLVDDNHMFGVPEKDDPDPYGVLALEKEGLTLREAGTHKRASWEEFAFAPSPTSPVHNMYARTSLERNSTSRRNSWRASALSNEPKTPGSFRNSMDSPRPTMVDMSTQTDLPDISSPKLGGPTHRSSRASLAASYAQPHMQEVPENEVLKTPIDEGAIDDKSAGDANRVNGYTTPPGTPPGRHQKDHVEQSNGHANDDADDEHDEVIEKPVVHSVQTVQPATQKAVSISKARIVNVPKRIPPKLPPRNPNRASKTTSTTSSESVPTIDTDAVSITDAHSAKSANSDNHVGETLQDAQDKLEDVHLGDEPDHKTADIETKTENSPVHLSTEDGASKELVKEASHETNPSQNSNPIPGTNPEEAKATPLETNDETVKGKAKDKEEEPESVGRHVPGGFD